MKKVLLFLLFVLLIPSVKAQTSLDSLRLVMPIGHTSGVVSAVFSATGKLALTASADNTARIYEVSSGKELQIFTGHIKQLSSAKFSPDEKLVLTYCDDYLDKTVRIYEVSSGRELQVLSGHTEVVNSAVFSADGKLVITASYDSTARIFEVATGKELHVLSGHTDMVSSAVFSKDGKYALTSSRDMTARIWDVASCKELQVLSGHSGEIVSTEFSPDSKLTITASDDNTARIYEVSSGKELHVLSGHTNEVWTAVFSKDGKYALTSSWDKTARVFEVATGKELHVLSGHTAGIRSAVFSADGKLAITAGDNTARIFEVATGKELHVLSGHTAGVSSAVFSTDGKYALTSSWDNTARIYEVSTGKELRVLCGHTEWIYPPLFNADGELVLNVSDENGARIYEVSSGKELQVIKDHKSLRVPAAFSSDGKLVLITDNIDNVLRIYEVSSGKELQVLGVHNDEIHSAVFSSDGALILAVGVDKIRRIKWTARIFEVSSGKVLQVLKGQKRYISSAVFNSNGELAITASYDNTARIYQVSTGKQLQVLKGHTNRLVSAVFSKDGKLALTASDSTARIYEVSSGRELQVLSGHTEVVNSAVFSEDGKLVITASYDNTARIYEVSTGKVLQVLRGHNEYVESAVFSSDGKRVLTASGDKTARIYDISKGKETLLLKHPQGIESAQFSPNGEYILANCGDHKTILLETATGKTIYERIQLENDNHLIKLSNAPYYMCSKDASRMLHYVTPSLKVIGFDQLDPVYNRPDIVLDSIGKYFGGADKELITNYRQSWEKRIDRLGLDKEKLGKGEISVPNAEIVGADNIAYENNNGKLNLKVAANDPKYPLRRFNVFVNEVPLYGSAGISIASLKKQEWDTTLSVPLSIGENKIQESVMNELGLENFKYPTYVYYTPTETITAKTYYIGIGVNEFKESGHKLNYCVKDVTDLAKSIGGPNTEVKLLTNAQVNKENILALKDYLNKTSVNDKVIISCSSHGLLDDSLNFYLAMHDVNFDNPKALGLKYEELESLLDGIPARQKLLLLDACNSGENDKTEVLKQELKQKEKSMNNSQLLAARGEIIQLVEENKSNFKKMNELFVNVRNNTGSVIISAAGGQESALEAIEVNGKAIENGAFTYSVLECLEQNKGKELKVSTLKQYTEKRVEEITNGKQKPTSRQETMEVDWEVW